jgi:plastocyanin
MTRLALCLAAVLTVAACAQQPFTTPDDKQPARKDVVVQFGNATVLPSDARLKAGGSVTWNNTSDYMAVVRFPKADKTKFTCRAVLRPDWQYVADAIESIPTGGASDRIVFPCTLQPGTYPYTISLFGNIADMDNPAFTLSANLIVE